MSAFSLRCAGQRARMLQGLRTAKGHVWTTPALQEDFGAQLRSGASHVSGLLSRRMTAGPDVVRGSAPIKSAGSTLVTQ